MEKHTCEECKQPAELKCSACKLVWYCNRDHQKKHWRVHVTFCRPFEVIEDPVKGNCLVATRDLQPGDLIVSELPLVYGPRPHMIEEGPVPCPGCCRLIIGEESTRCGGCDYPVCHPECPGLKRADRHGLECHILGLREVQAINGLHAFYRQDVLLLLRCLLMQKKHPKRYASLMALESHWPERGPDTAIYRHNQQHVFDYLDDNFLKPLRVVEQSRLGHAVLLDTSVETIHKISGIIDVNALDINHDAEMSALYANACLLEHSCLCNTVHQFADADDNFRITVKAAIGIKRGQRITTMYTHALWGTQARREHLFETKYFKCDCQRCRDPTELGTYLGALKCLGIATDDAAPPTSECQQPQRNCDGIQLPVDPLDDNTEWACDKCPARLQTAQVAVLINKIGEEVDAVQLSDPTVRDLDALLVKMGHFLHPNHYHMFSVKHSLIQLYGYQQGYTANQITDENLQRKITMCKDLLGIIDRIDPGNARLPLYTAVILHELYLANMILVRRKWDVGIKAKVKSIMVILKECQQCLHRAIDVLKMELGMKAGRKLCDLINISKSEFEKWLERHKVNMSKQDK